MDWSCVLYVPASLLPGKLPSVPVGGLRFDEPRGRSGRFGEEKNLLLPPGIEPRFLDFSAHSLVNILTTLSLESCETVFVLVVSIMN